MADTKSITIERIFDAPREKVWQAWTTPEMVKKWWGPEGFTAPSIKIDFRVGGKYFYVMHGSKGSEFDRDYYSGGVYKEIVPMKKLVITDYFSDEKGNKVSPKEYGMGPGMPEESDIIVKFEDAGENKTKLSIIYEGVTEKQYDAMMKSGMKEGWNSSLDKLAENLK